MQRQNTTNCRINIPEFWVLDQSELNFKLRKFKIFNN